MRALCLLLIAVVALGTVLVGCGGDEPQQQTQALQEQAGQADQPSTAAAERSAGEQRAEVAQESTEQQKTDQGEAEAQQRGDSPARDPLFAEAEAAYQAWSDNLQTFVLDADIEVNLGGLETQIQTTISMQIEPLTILMSVDASSLTGMATSLGVEEMDPAEESLLMHMLIGEESAYLSMPEFGGWVDVSEDFGELLGGLTTLLGADPEDFANLDGLGQAFGCIDVVGGAIAVGRYAGESIWMVDCEIDVEALNEASAQALTEMGIEVVDSGIETMRLRMAISQESGAPLLIESRMTLVDPFGVMGGDADDSGDEQETGLYVNQAATLRSWNEPLEFPVPEPLVDGSLLGELTEPTDAESFSAAEPPELLTPAELLELALGWAADVDELHVQFVAQAVIDDEPRQASTVVRGSRSRGMFETAVNIDNASTFRLLWDREGIWVSDSEVDGQPVWAPSSPALLGFAGMTVDEFLAGPDRLNLDPLRALLDISWLSRTIEGSAPPVYELGIESGPLARGDTQFEAVVEILKHDTVELLAESVVIESIDHYSTILTISGDDGEVVSQVTIAEFQTSAGRVELMASVHLVGERPIEFSEPTK